MYLSALTMNKFKKYSQQMEAVILPIGTTEAHGPHCPLGTDFLIPERIAALIDSKMNSRILIAPTVNYGCSWGLKVFPGTINISTETMMRYLVEIGTSLLQWGLKKQVFLNGHGGNRPALRTAAQHLADAGAQVLVIDWWADYMPQILEICDSRGHAGEDETSVMLAIMPENIEMDLATANDNRAIGQIYTADISFTTLQNAMTGDATKATAEKGKQILKVVSNEIMRLIDQFSSGCYVK